MKKNAKSRPSFLFFFVLIIVVIVGIALVSTISGASVKASKAPEVGVCEYYNSYVEAGGPEMIGELNLKEPTELVEEFEAKSLPVSAELNAVVSEIKGKICEKYGEYKALNWTRFDNVTVKLTSYSNGRYEALYYEKTNTLYIFEQATRGRKRDEIIAHELIHSLTMTEANRKSFFYEGLTEYLAQQVYDTDSASYVHVYAFAEAYCNKYGLEKALADGMDDTAWSDIDERLGLPGASKNLAALAYITDSQMQVQAYPQLVLTEVYYRYCRALGIEIPSETKGWLTMLLRASGAQSSDMGYLARI